MRISVLIALAILFPAVGRAAVLINEVAWMGTSASANAEWIELSNTGSSPVDLTGWHLVAENGSPSITLTGSIAANGYFLLERTSDASVPDAAADQIYTGALTNSGTTLTLTDGDGTSINIVTGGANWVSIGGDNASKETAQRTDSGWRTAVATPRAMNAGMSAVPDTSNTTQAASTTLETTSTESETVPASSGGVAEYLPIPTLRIVTLGNRTVSSGADTAFTATVYDGKGNKRADAHITWSFGDGMQRIGADVFHSFYHPGEYVVVVHAKTPDEGDALAESIITVQEASITIASVTTRGIALANTSSRTLDLSHWRLVMGGQEFKIPGDTQVLAGRTVLFPLPVIGLPFADSAALLYPSGAVAATYPAALPTTLPQPSSVPVSYNERQEVEPITRIQRNIQPHDDAVEAPAAAMEIAAAGAALTPFEKDAVTKPTSSSVFRSPWIYSLLGVIAVAGAAFVLL